MIYTLTLRATDIDLKDNMFDSQSQVSLGFPFEAYSLGTLVPFVGNALGTLVPLLLAEVMNNISIQKNGENKTQEEIHG